MQGRKGEKPNKHAYRVITLTAGPETMYHGPVSGLPVREAAILEKSVEFFGDPEPCMIHRSAVLARVYEELEHWLDCQGAGRECAVERGSLPQRLAACLDLGAGHG